KRDAGLDRQGPARLLERLPGAEYGGLNLKDVLGRLDDDQVGAAMHQAAGLFGENGQKLPEGDLAEGGIVTRRQEAGGSDGAGDEACIPGRLARDLRRPEVDLVRVLFEAPLRELEPGTLEGVGLQHLGTSGQHRLVHTLDHVGPVEDQRLVAAAWQLVVVFEAEVELLERGPHAAVVDDDALPCRCQEISHEPRVSNLDTSVARLAWLSSMGHEP